jgi:acyl-CoA thioester hydrolase
MAHEATFRVYYEDTDMGGVVYHANYLKFIERARSDALREAGIDQRLMREQGFVFVVTRIEADYVSPARYDDVLTVKTGTVGQKGASATMRQEVFLGEKKLFIAEVKFACMTMEGRPVRMPSNLHAVLEGL